MKKNTARGLIVLALLLCVFSVVAFIVHFAKTVTFWLAYSFGVFALLFQLYIFRTADAAGGDAKSRFYGFPIARIGVLYLAIQLIVSFIEMALAKVLPTWVPLIVNLILLVVAVIGCMTVETMRDEIVHQDVALKKKVSTMRELQSLSSSLVGQCFDETLKPILQKLADEFRYSDPVSSEKTIDIETEMKSQIGDIQQALVEGDLDGARKLCEKLKGNLAERNRICSVSKQ